MYFQHTVYFSDQAVVAPFVAFVVLEVLGRRVEGRAGRALRWLQYAVLLYGVATDWLFVPVMAVTLLKRRATGELGATARERWKNALVFCAGPGLVAAAFLAQLYSVGAIGALVDKGFRRAGVGTAGVDQLRQVGGFGRRFWGEFFARGFGRVGAPLVWAASAVWVLALLGAVAGARVKRRAVASRVRLLLEATGMLLGPCLLQVYLFRNHSAVHSFSVLKFSPVLAAVPFFFARCWPGRSWRRNGRPGSSPPRCGRPSAARAWRWRSSTPGGCTRTPSPCSRATTRRTVRSPPRSGRSAGRRTWPSRPTS
jgi:hypothetical protein